jgi:hypothetical protein
MAWVEPFHNSTLSEVRQFAGFSRFQQDPPCNPDAATFPRWRAGPQSGHAAVHSLQALGSMR